MDDSKPDAYVRSLVADRRAIEGLPVRLVIALVVGVASLSVMMGMIGDIDGLAATEIGHRLRFWIPENRPGISAAVTDDDLPPRTIDPSDPLDGDEADEFFDGLLDFVRSERDSEISSNRSSYERHDVERRLHRPEVTGAFERVGGIDRGAERSGTSRSTDTRGPDDGTYRYRLPDISPEHVDLRGDHSLFAGNWCLADAQPQPEVTTPGTQTLEVAVVDPDGKRVSDATVIVRGGSARMDGVATARTGADGVATLEVSPSLGANQLDGTLTLDVKPPAGSDFVDERGNTEVLVVAD